MRPVRALIYVQRGKKKYLQRLAAEQADASEIH